MIKLKEFKANIRNIVKPNRFKVEVFSPTEFPIETKEEFVFLAQAAKIPEKTVGSIDLKYHGATFQIPGDYAHDDLSITFINDYKWEARSFFEDWIESIQKTQGDNTRGNLNSIFDGASVIITQLGNTEDDILAKYGFDYIFPKGVQAIDLGMENDQVEMFVVDFGYAYSYRIKPTVKTVEPSDYDEIEE